MRDVLAAWVLCCLVGLGGLLLAEAADSHRSVPGTYAEVRIPGRGPIADSHLSIADEFADATERGDLVAGDREGRELTRLATSPAPAPRHCWIDNLRRRLLGAG